MNTRIDYELMKCQPNTLDLKTYRETCVIGAGTSFYDEVKSGWDHLCITYIDDIGQLHTAVKPHVYIDDLGHVVVADPDNNDYTLVIYRFLNDEPTDNIISVANCITFF